MITTSNALPIGWASLIHCDIVGALRDAAAGRAIGTCTESQARIVILALMCAFCHIVGQGFLLVVKLAGSLLIFLLVEDEIVDRARVLWTRPALAILGLLGCACIGSRKTDAATELATGAELHASIIVEALLGTLLRRQVPFVFEVRVASACAHVGESEGIARSFGVRRSQPIIL